MSRLSRTLGLAVLALLALPTVALADVPRAQPTLALPYDQVWVIGIGLLVPLVTYVVNHAAPWMDEKVKVVVLILAAAVAAALYQALDSGDLGFNGKTAEMILSAVVAAGVAHNWFWRPSGINVALGGGRNRQTER